MLENSMLNYTETSRECDSCSGTGKVIKDRIKFEEDIQSALADLYQTDLTAKMFFDLMEDDDDPALIDRANLFLCSINKGVSDMMTCPRCEGAGEIWDIRG